MLVPNPKPSSITWVLESEMFPVSHSALRTAVMESGHKLLDWDDEWWYDGFPSKVGHGTTFFHGSLGNAARIHEELKWTPGSYCDASVFCCSAWYDDAKDWLLHTDWRFLPANEFVEHVADVAESLGCSEQIFVRPDSPLKPFSGRVLDVTAPITLRSLDHGFYYDDEALPIVACPIQKVGREWRFVVVQGRVIAGSAYDASTRKAIADKRDSDAWIFAQSVASSMAAPADVYVLDVCEESGKFRLLELNPFGGADLYACNVRAIVEALADNVSSIYFNIPSAAS